MSNVKYANAFISFLPSTTIPNINRNRNAQIKTFNLLIHKMTQAHSLQGSQVQSKLTRHFYPQYYIPGDLVFYGKAESQEDYQDLARFIRLHQESLIGGNAFSSILSNNNTNGFNYLMNVLVPAEGINLQGWIANFNLSKKGVFDPAPEYLFNFTIAYDPMRSSNTVTQNILKWYSNGTDDYSGENRNLNYVKTNQTTPSKNNTSPATTPNIPAPIRGLQGSAAGGKTFKQLKGYQGGF